jgi:hypothetical protein
MVLDACVAPQHRTSHSPLKKRIRSTHTFTQSLIACLYLMYHNRCQIAVQLHLGCRQGRDSESDRQRAHARQRRARNQDHPSVLGGAPQGQDELRISLLGARDQALCACKTIIPQLLESVTRPRSDRRSKLKLVKKESYKRVCKLHAQILCRTIQIESQSDSVQSGSNMVSSQIHSTAFIDGMIQT